MWSTTHVRYKKPVISRVFGFLVKPLSNFFTPRIFNLGGVIWFMNKVKTRLPKIFLTAFYLILLLISSRSYIHKEVAAGNDVLRAGNGRDSLTGGLGVDATGAARQGGSLGVTDCTTRVLPGAVGSGF